MSNNDYDGGGGDDKQNIDEEEDANSNNSAPIQLNSSDVPSAPEDAAMTTATSEALDLTEFLQAVEESHEVNERILSVLTEATNNEIGDSDILSRYRYLTDINIRDSLEHISGEDDLEDGEGDDEEEDENVYTEENTTQSSESNECASMDVQSTVNVDEELEGLLVEASDSNIILINTSGASEMSVEAEEVDSSATNNVTVQNDLASANATTTESQEITPTTDDTVSARSTTEEAATVDAGTTTNATPHSEITPELRAVLGDIEIPEGVDPSFLAALPVEMREEVIQEHLRMNRATSRSHEHDTANTPQAPLPEVSAEFLAALPPNIQTEVLMQQRMEQQRRAAQSINPEDPVDPVEFFENLPEALRQAVSDDQIIEVFIRFFTVSL